MKPAPKVKVVLQKRIGDSKKWSTEAKLKTSKKGAFSYTDKPKNPGVRYYRVVVPKAGRVKAGKSKPVKVTVLAWRSLTNTQFRQSESTAVSYGVSIAGTPYSPAIAPQAGAAQGHADWNLDPSCTTLRVRVGNGDQSEANATGQIVLTDALKGTTLVSKSFGLTQSEVAPAVSSLRPARSRCWPSPSCSAPETSASPARRRQRRPAGDLGLDP